ELNEGDLEALGVLLGHRKKILRAIAQLSQSADVTDPRSIPVAVIPEEQSFPPERDQADRRQLTVMFCDLVDSTALSRRLDPEDLQEVIRQYQETCTTVIRRYEGYIAQHLGDGLLVYFGYPVAHEDDARRAVRAGLEIVQALRKQVPSSLVEQSEGVEKRVLQVRIGIHTGLVVIGEIGSSEKRE